MCVANVKLYEDSAAVKCSASYTLYSVCARGHLKRPRSLHYVSKQIRYRARIIAPKCAHNAVSVTVFLMRSGGIGRHGRERENFGENMSQRD